VNLQKILYVTDLFIYLPAYTAKLLQRNPKQIEQVQDSLFFRKDVCRITDVKISDTAIPNRAWLD